MFKKIQSKTRAMNETLNPRVTPLLSAVEKNRQLVIYDTIYDKKLHYKYDILDPFDVRRLYDLTVAIYNEYFDIDFKLLNDMLKKRAQIFKILLKYNYVKSLAILDNDIKNNDIYNNDEVLVLQEIRKIIPRITLNHKNHDAPSNININETRKESVQHSFDNDLNASDISITQSVCKIQLSKLHIPKTPAGATCCYKLKLPTKLISDNVSLYNFETMAFDNKTAFSLYPNCLFSTYFYQNTMYYLNLTQNALKNDNRWQAKLSNLLHHTKFSEYVALEAFYVNSITTDGIVYDTSFVPKYKVRDLKRRAHRLNANSVLISNNKTAESIKIPIVGTFNRHTDAISDEYLQNNSICSSKSCEYVKYISDNKMFEFRDQINIKSIQIIPERYLKIFSIFPFKDGHYVDSSGKIHVIYLNKPTDVKSTTSLVATLRQVYRAKNMESAIYECATLYKFKQLLSFVAYNNNLDLQGMGLIVLRAMCGNYIKIEESGKLLRLPYSNEVLAWLKYYCSGDKCVNYNYDKNSMNIILFPKEPDPSTSATRTLLADSYALVKSIAQTARSELDCSFICSRYTIQPVIYSLLYNKLNLHAEMYVFLTIAIQKTNLNSYREFKDKLKPTWVGNLSHNELFNSYPPSVNTRVADPCLKNLTDRNLVRILKPTEMYYDVLLNNVTRDTLDNYEFTNTRLQELIKNGTTKLSDFEIMALITFKLTRKMNKTNWT